MIYDILTLFLTLSINILAGLKAGIFLAGIEMVIFFEIFLPFFQPES